MTFTCMRSVTLDSAPLLLLLRLVSPAYYIPGVHYDHYHPSGAFQHPRHICQDGSSPLHRLTTIFLSRQHFCQQRPKSYYGLGRNRRGKFFLRPEPDSLPPPTNLLRPSADTIAQYLHQPRPAEAKPDAFPDYRVDVTEDAYCFCSS